MVVCFPEDDERAFLNVLPRAAQDDRSTTSGIIPVWNEIASKKTKGTRIPLVLNRLSLTLLVDSFSQKRTWRQNRGTFARARGMLW
jgi:hypothetical protein